MTWPPPCMGNPCQHPQLGPPLLLLQNLDEEKQLLYDFPWTNVGKLVFVVSATIPRQSISACVAPGSDLGTGCCYTTPQAG